MTNDDFLLILMILMQGCWIAAVEVQMLKVPLKVFFPGIFTDFEETILFFATDADDFDDDCNQLQLWIWC